jgi:hypothetical protein
LPARPVEGLLEVVFGRDRGVGTAHQEQKLAFKTQQFGNCPPSFGALRPLEPLIDRGEPLAELAGSAQGVCQNSSECNETRCQTRSAKLVESGAYMLQTGDQVAALDEQRSLKAATPTLPSGQTMLGRGSSSIPR